MYISSRKVITLNLSSNIARDEYIFHQKHGKIHIDKYIGSSSIITIPQYIDDKPVTKIENWAFWHVGNLSEITIPDGVREVGAFNFCSNLKKATFCGPVYGRRWNTGPDFFHTSLEEIEGIENLKGANITYYKFRGTPFLEKNKTLIIDDRLIWCRENTEIYKVPDNVKTIAAFAFSNSQIKKIILPANLKAIESDAFFGSEIEEIDIPESVEKAEQNIFECCVNLKKITFPKDFIKRKGWNSHLSVSHSCTIDGQIADTEFYPCTNNDTILHKDVRYIMNERVLSGLSRRLFEKQIFPEKLEYLKDACILSFAKTNIFRNDDFYVERSDKVLDNYSWIAGNITRRFLIVFDLPDKYAEVLIWFSFVPYQFPGSNPQNRKLINFYNTCLKNSQDGKFFDFDFYDNNILMQDIPFIIKAEIAFKRLSSDYRLKENAKENYIQYFKIHEKRLNRLLKKSDKTDMKEFFRNLI